MNLVWIPSNSRRLALPHRAPSLCLLLSLSLAGCANPGPPRPPSLNLPSPVKDLHAERIGSDVRLTWTTPTNSTDDLALKPPLSAEICRDLDQRTQPAPSVALCTPVQHLPVQPGPGTAVDPLPAALLTDPAHLLRYRIRLLNASGRSADASNPTFAATGQAPSPVTNLHSTTSSPAGTRLLWSAVATPAAAVLLDRTTTATPSPTNSQPGGQPGSPIRPPHPSSKAPAASPNSKPAAPITTRLQASPAGPDPGGAIDPSTQPNATYSYIAWRSRSVQIAGQTLTLRSPDSAPLLLTIRDTTPPATPTGLVAIVDRAQTPTQTPAGAASTAPAGSASASGSVAASGYVDLSWEPDADPDLAGYWIERAPAPPSPAASPAQPEPPWQRLNPTPIPGPSFRDLTPAPGTFRYRVLAVDTTGNLSPPSPSVTVTIPR